MAFDRYREFIKRLSPTVLSSGWGEKLQGTIAGLAWDALADGVTQAIKSPWISLGLEQPVDAVPVLADERKLPRYLIETPEQWQARVDDVWDIWGAGGAEPEIAAQYAAAGYPATIYSPLDWNRSPFDWWSQFWILITAAGPFGPPAVAGSAVEGQHLCGVSGPTANVTEVRQIVAGMRPGHVVCRSIIIRLSGTICGTGAIEGAHLCGGTQAQIGTGLDPN